ncbi:hypothetical protein [Burkholderia vietnamiensis]|uniref:hypothetical protein n=1 Tax=Burkholderia vietnamiensis TaxID=60552 RepID=UPI002653E55F|nr:hypothetical protein [Burkholderia vietnamiensis]MDN8038529.1 hypothetical protein [Burkholderia vietnamiensis]
MTTKPASPASQPAATPIDGQICQHCGCIRPLHDLDCPVAIEAMKPTPSPADERAAFSVAQTCALKHAISSLTADGLEASARELEALLARASSANETGAEGADALAHEVWSAAQRAPGEGIEDAVQRVAAILSRSPAMAAEAVDWRELSRRLYVELFHCDQQMRSTRDEEGEPHWTQSAVVRDVLADAKAALDGAPAQAAEAVAIPPLVRYQILTEEGGWLDVPQAYYERFKGDPTLTRVVNPMQPMAAHDESSIEKHFDDYGFYLHGFEEEDREAFFQAAMALIAAPQPAQADARVGLTDEQRDVLTWAIGRANSQGEDACADVLRSILASQPGRPVPRAEVTDAARAGEAS